MLAALELNGFKSFAERTRFEFPAGITVVVGPNGSGKSNVVDAIKWVLGSQSVKALRGKESTDVIFSGARTRRPANAAEASLVFDNSAGILDHDASEVQITRRVYRSGETEYLINRQPCRLRDIRDLLAGVGMANGAYSIIEQGKVDSMLQSSPKERRLIFEEAAGVSRFRMKREEALRRMERVQQSLLRLSDIVGELQSRLKSVRSQAGRAQRYTELTKRLAELRTAAGRDDWRRLSRLISDRETQVAAKTTGVESLEVQLKEADAAVAALDVEADSLQAELQSLGAAEAEIRERLAQSESTRSSHLVRIDELEQEVQRLSRQILTLTSRAGDSRQLVAETTDELAASRTQLTTLEAALAEAQRDVAALEAEAKQRQDESAAARSRLDAAEREAAELGVAGQLAAARRLSLATLIARSEKQASTLDVERKRLAAEAAVAATELAACSSALETAAKALDGSERALRDGRSALAADLRRLSGIEGRLTGARERIAVLEDLERQLDGLTAGAKDVLQRAREQPAGPFGCVQGVVADLLCVDADSAPLVEIALGERANYLVVTDATSLAPTLVADPSAWPSRTSFLRLDVPTPASAVDRVDLSDVPGVMGRADQFVEAPAELAPMVRRLLARHWFVDSLKTALQLAGGEGRGLNFVTVAGETVLADGTLTVGPRQNMAGFLSRRSELRALKEQIDRLEHEAAETRAACERQEAQGAAGEAAVRQLSERHAAALHRHGDARLAAGSLEDKLKQTESRSAAVAEESRQATAERDALDQTESGAQDRLVALRAEMENLRLDIEQSADRRLGLDVRRGQLHQAVADLRVQLARSEQRVDGLRRQMEQLQRDHAERDKTLAETRERADQCRQQNAKLAQAVLELSQESTDLLRRKEELTARLAALEQSRESRRQNRQAAAVASDRIRQQLLGVQRELQAARLELEKHRQNRDLLAERLREDYKIDVASLAAEPSTEAAASAEEAVSQAVLDRPAVESEIRQLREQLDAAGPVNLESLAELESLERRHGDLARQYEDLQEARTRLENIITQINGESRQLFTDAVAEIRGHFQEIFRRLFGGGEADIVIETEADGDVLESGISIIARPPGKQPRNISLLSGGERTMTCVALLLAMFRSRPSPFCVLDEVDAALDEPNIERFVDVLKQFMQNTQFIVITHSKRTMIAGDSLYGVTMQESGVSKRVSVRFEDVSEDGHIRPAALASESPPQSRAA